MLPETVLRRILTAASVAALLLSSLGSVLALEPVGSADPAPVVEPAASDQPTPSGPRPDAVVPAGPSGEQRVTPDPIATAPAQENNGASSDGGSVDPTGRWLVVLRDGTNVADETRVQGRKIGLRADRTFSHAFRGFAAKLDRHQVTMLRTDPSVAYIVHDEKIEAEAQLIPTGVSRIGATRSTVAKIDGIDERVDADIAIVDTGIKPSLDVNVVGGYNCSTADPTAWGDGNGHGTHVAGIAGAIDNGGGVVGVAPGVRLWAVRILNSGGAGLLSWYVCGLDWIAAQRDAADPTRPLFEAANMSVAKWGSDDGHCGATNSDVLHAAICRLVASGVTVVAAAGNDSSSAAARVPAAYDEVITVSALADTDGRPGGLGGHRCFSWGTYDSDDTFADFSNRGWDIDLIAPGKCIWSTILGGFGYMSGTSMAAPHVTGAVALLKATRPALTPREVKEALQYLGNYGWKTWTDPDKDHEKLLDVSKLGPRGDFSVAVGAAPVVGEAGGAVRIPIRITRTPTSFERIRLEVSGLPAGMTAPFDQPTLYGFAGVASTLTINLHFGMATGTYPLTVTADEHGNRHSTAATVVVVSDAPTARPPTTAAQDGAKLGVGTLSVRVSWSAATDPTSGIGAYELATSVDGGPWVSTMTANASTRSVVRTQSLGHAYRYRLRARDTVGNWSGWATGPNATGVLVQNTMRAVVYHGTWTRAWYSYASGGSTSYALAAGARAGTTFSGRGVAIVAPRGPGRGSATIYVDGTYRATISFRAATNHGRVIVYSTTFGSVATHSIEMRLTGTGRVDLDTFVILR